MTLFIHDGSPLFGGGPNSHPLRFGDGWSHNNGLGDGEHGTIGDGNGFGGGVDTGYGNGFGSGSGDGGPTEPVVWEMGGFRWVFPAPRPIAFSYTANWIENFSVELPGGTLQFPDLPGGTEHIPAFPELGR